MNKLKLAQIKSKALELRKNYQLPYYLVYLIYNLSGGEKVEYIRFLIEMSTHLLRVRNYYKLFPQVDKDATLTIKNGLKELGFHVDNYE